MTLDPGAGAPAPREALVDVPRLVTDYFAVIPSANEAEQRVSFGTSGHRGTSGDGSFNEAHVASISQAVADHRHARGVTGPLFLGADTHALSDRKSTRLNSSHVRISYAVFCLKKKKKTTKTKTICTRKKSHNTQ